MAVDANTRVADVTVLAARPTLVQVTVAPTGIVRRGGLNPPSSMRIRASSRGPVTPDGSDSSTLRREPVSSVSGPAPDVSCAGIALAIELQAVVARTRSSRKPGTRYERSRCARG